MVCKWDKGKGGGSCVWIFCPSLLPLCIHVYGNICCVRVLIKLEKVVALLAFYFQDTEFYIRHVYSLPIFPILHRCEVMKT